MPARAALTLSDRLPPGGDPVQAARTALTRRSGQPRPLEPEAADYWAARAATLHEHLQAGGDVSAEVSSGLGQLPFLGRYQDCINSPNEADDDIDFT